MVVWAFEAGLRDLVERKADVLPLLQRVARRRPEKRVGFEEATAALAAAEVVAAAAGRPMADPPDALNRWLAANPGAPSVPLMAAAIKAIDRLSREPALPPGVPLDDLRARLHGR